MISTNTKVTVTNGASAIHLRSFDSGQFREAKRKVKEALAAAGSSPQQLGQMEYARHFSKEADDIAVSRVPGTFKILPNGECSRLTNDESAGLLVIERRRMLREIRELKRLLEKGPRREERRKR